MLLQGRVNGRKEMNIELRLSSGIVPLRLGNNPVVQDGTEKCLCVCSGVCAFADVSAGIWKFLDLSRWRKKRLRIIRMKMMTTRTMHGGDGDDDVDDDGDDDYDW